MTRRASRIGVVAIGVLVTLAALAGIAAFRATARTVPEDTADIHADAALVLSGDVDYLRVKHAIALVREGRVRTMLLTGKGVGGDSAEAMRALAVAAGVEPGAVVIESESESTRENVLFAAPIVARHGWRRIALVTSRSHLTRALAAARHAMPDVVWIPAPVPDAGSADRARRLRVEEAVKLLWYKARGWA